MDRDIASPIPMPVFFVVTKSIKDSFWVLDSRTVIDHLDQYLARVRFCGLNSEAGGIRPSFHCIDGIQNQIDEDPLHLNQVNAKMGRASSICERSIQCMAVVWYTTNSDTKKKRD